MESTCSPPRYRPPYPQRSEDSEMALGPGRLLGKTQRQLSLCLVDIKIILKLKLVLSLYYNKGKNSD